MKSPSHTHHTSLKLYFHTKIHHKFETLLPFFVKKHEIFFCSRASDLFWNSLNSYSIETSNIRIVFFKNISQIRMHFFHVRPFDFCFPKVFQLNFLFFLLKSILWQKSKMRSCCSHVVMVSFFAIPVPYTHTHVTYSIIFSIYTKKKNAASLILVISMKNRRNVT